MRFLYIQKVQSYLVALLFLAAFSGCSAVEKPDNHFNTEVHVHVRDELDKATAADSAKTGIANDKSFVIASPNPVIQTWENPLMNEELYSDKVGVRLVEKRFDSSNVYIVVSVRNNSSNSQRIRLYVFGYDKNNRMVKVEDKAINLSAKEESLRSYTYARSLNITRWFVAVQET